MQKVRILPKLVLHTCEETWMDVKKIIFDYQKEIKYLTKKKILLLKAFFGISNYLNFATKSVPNI